VCVSLQYPVDSETEGGRVKLDFTRYSFSSRPLYKNQNYYSQTPPLCGHPPPSPSSPTLLRNTVFPPDHPVLQYMPYNIGNGNIVQRPSVKGALCA